MSEEPQFRAYLRRRMMIGVCVAPVGIVIGIVCNSMFTVGICAVCGVIALVRLMSLQD